MGNVSSEKVMKKYDVIDNSKLCAHFKCSPQGGMRKSNTTNTLVIISNHVKSIYDDRWIKDVFHYTGMGLKGNQDINRSQNKTLSKSNETPISVHLLEVFKKEEYTYLGEAYLAQNPYQETQIGKDGLERIVWMFPLKLKDESSPIIENSQLNSLKEIKRKKAEKLNDEELKHRARFAPKKPGTRTSQTTQFERNDFIAEFTKRTAKGVCQLCNSPAPFSNKKKNPYLECHHIIWLSKGGEDTIQNTVALCPNCHRKMHILNDPKDILFLQTISKS
jgi:5-methylcytosine-specific restriction protein A